jgi:hypothetical protein
MTTNEVQDAQLAQLEAQQSLFTQILQALLEGYWCGEPPSADAFLHALDPNLTFGCLRPILTSDEPPQPPQYYNPDEPCPAQLYDWTCSACSTEYTERAAGMGRGGDPYANREAVVYAIGYTHNINPTYGLMDGSGAQLQRVLMEQAGLSTEHAYLSFDEAYAIYSHTFGLASGGALYHWVAIKGAQDGLIQIANSAEGYKGVYSTLDRSQWNTWGPWSCLWIT